MARIAPLKPEQAEPPVLQALERLPPLKIFATVANAQGTFVNFLRFGQDCLDGRYFDPVLRELAILRVARLTPGADYEWVPRSTRSKARTRWRPRSARMGA
jgi:hypothetical protein